MEEFFLAAGVQHSCAEQRGTDRPEFAHLQNSCLRNPSAPHPSDSIGGNQTSSCCMKMKISEHAIMPVETHQQKGNHKQLEWQSYDQIHPARTGWMIHE